LALEKRNGDSTKAEMKEKLVFRFIRNDQLLPIDDLAPLEFDRGGVALDGEASAWPRGLRARRRGC